MSNKAMTHAAVEVLPPEKNNARILAELKQKLTAEWGAYYQMEREAALRACRMGLMLLSIKRILPHGEFGRWCQDNLPVTERAGQRFMKLAEFFLENAQLPKQDVLLLAEGQQAVEVGGKKAKKVEQLLLDFVGDRSQAELFAFYGVTGGKREVTGHRRTDEQILRDEVRIVWGKERLGELALHGIERKTWRHLERKDLEMAFEVFRTIYMEMKEELKVRHGIKAEKH